MPLILLIETATEVCSVAVAKQNQVLATANASHAFEHSSQLTVLIQACLDDASISFPELQAVALSKGPGSYTSLRVGTSVAKGICYALDIPLIAIDTLASIAWATHQVVNLPDAIYCPMIDARRMEVYAALYDSKGNAITPVENLIINEQSFQTYWEQEKTIVFSGSGAAKCQTIIQSPFATFEPLLCDARYLASFAQTAFEFQKFENTAYFEPFYGKAPNITTPKQRL